MTYEIDDLEKLSPIMVSDFSNNITIEKVIMILNNDYQTIEFKLIITKIDYRILLSKLQRRNHHKIHNLKNNRKLTFSNYNIEKDIIFLRYLFKTNSDLIKITMTIQFKNQFELILKLFEMEEIFMDCNECVYLNINEYEQRVLKLKNKNELDNMIEHRCNLYDEKLYHYEEDNIKIKPCELCEKNNSFKETKE